MSEHGIVLRLCALITIGDLPLELLNEAVLTMSLLTNPSISKDDPEPAEDVTLVPPTDAVDDLGSLTELFHPMVMETLSQALMVDQAKSIVLQLLVKVGSFEGGCNAIASCNSLVAEISRIILSETDLQVLFHALRLLLCVCAVPAARSAFGVHGSWLAMLVMNSDDVGRQSRFCQVLDVLCNDRSSMGILLRADILAEIHRCFLELTVERVIAKPLLVTIFRSLLMPICKFRDVVAELAESDGLVSLLLRFLASGVCPREVLSVFTQLAGSAPGCALLRSNEFEFLPLLLALCREAAAAAVLPETAIVEAAGGSDPDGESMYSPCRVFVSYALWCLGRLCGEPEGLAAALALDPELPTIWLQSLVSPSILLRQRSLLGLRYLLLHSVGRGTCVHCLSMPLSILLRSSSWEVMCRTDRIIPCSSGDADPPDLECLLNL